MATVILDGNILIGLIFKKKKKVNVAFVLFMFIDFVINISMKIHQRYACIRKRVSTVFDKYPYILVNTRKRSLSNYEREVCEER